ncbi:MAG: hypothetical protein H0U92_02580 [Actinobacteria bacterium]|nr:hypothetical protein [Actinomycetota bacterium]
MTTPEEGDRWRLPLEPMRGGFGAATPEPVAPSAPEPAANGHHASADQPLEFEAPDVTARFVVAELGELNEHLAALTEIATVKSDATLEKLHSELRRITSLREVDLTEQAAGIFAAVRAGAEALDQFATVVNKVTTDLQSILEDALASIGGTQGLAAWVAQSAADVTDVRREIRNAFARIERDMSVLRSQQPVEHVKITLGDDQLTFIVEAVAESVVSALTTQQLRAASGRRR